MITFAPFTPFNFFDEKENCMEHINMNITQLSIAKAVGQYYLQVSCFVLSAGSRARVSEKGKAIIIDFFCANSGICWHGINWTPVFLNWGKVTHFTDYLY